MISESAAMERLATVVASLADAVGLAGTGFPDGSNAEDMQVIQEQVGRAAITVEEVRVAVNGEAPRDPVFVLLHRLNNQLTGVLSLTLLIKDDVRAGHPVYGTLERIDHLARDAAATVKELAALLKRTAAETTPS